MHFGVNRSRYTDRQQPTRGIAPTAKLSDPTFNH